MIDELKKEIKRLAEKTKDDGYLNETTTLDFYMEEDEYDENPICIRVNDFCKNDTAYIRSITISEDGDEILSAIVYNETTEEDEEVSYDELGNVDERYMAQLIKDLYW